MIPEDEIPMRLQAAALAVFPDGSISAAALRREAEKGNLSIERIAGKDYTTVAAINAMREKCRVQPKQPNRMTRSGRIALEDAETERRRRVQAALMAKLKNAKARGKPEPAT